MIQLKLEDLGHPNLKEIFDLFAPGYFHLPRLLSDLAAVSRLILIFQDLRYLKHRFGQSISLKKLISYYVHIVINLIYFLL